MKKKFLIEVEDITNSDCSETKENSAENSINSATNQQTTDFMIHMYDQMFVTIDRTYKNVWEMILAIGGGIGVLQLYDKHYAFDIAVIGYIIGLVWILVRLIDANYWCNRNLFIIHKIENSLLKEKAQELFYDFRVKKRPIENEYHFSMVIQIAFVSVILFTTLSMYIISQFQDCFKEIKLFIDANALILLLDTFLFIVILVGIVKFKRDSDFKLKATGESEK